jgi:hypothetical protein
VTLLREFGHLEDRATSDLLLAAADASEGAPIDLEAIRRISAQYLLESQGSALLDGHGILAEDWPLLYS